MPKHVEKVKLICDSCQKEYWVYPSRIRWDKVKGYKSHFCSRACKYEGDKKRPGYWKNKKMPITARKKMSENHADVSGNKNPNWQGGRRISKGGYILLWKPEHPDSDYHGYVREHRLVMESKIGRSLASQEVVHHINHDRQDNRPENLMLLKNASEHQKLHSKLNRAQKT